MEQSEIQESVFSPDSAEPVLSEVEGLHLGYVAFALRPLTLALSREGRGNLAARRQHNPRRFPP